MANMNSFEPTIASLRLVMKIVETGKLTSAAAQLHMSQSGASHALSVLESQAGTELFIREWEGLRLSEAGQRLLPYIEGILNNVESIRSEIAGLSQLESGNLRVAAVPSLLSSILPPFLREYSRRYPGVEVSAFEGTDDEVRMWIISGMAHVGFAALPVAGVIAEEIGRDEWLAMVPAGKFAGKASITLRELAQHRFLMSGGGCEPHIQSMFASVRIHIAEHLMVKQMPTIQAMVAEDLGVSLVPSLSVNKVRGCRTLPLQPRRFRNIGMLRSTNPGSSPALEAWMSLVRTKAQSAPGLAKTRPSARSDRAR
jgi:DNA-binding transcriptional LysR family regulator